MFTSLFMNTLLCLSLSYACLLVEAKVGLKLGLKVCSELAKTNLIQPNCRIWSVFKGCWVDLG